VRTHHAPLRASVGNVSERLHAVAEPPGGVDGPLRSVSARFSDLAAVLLAHFDKEENILFPALTLLAESRRHGTPRPSLPFPSVLYPIRVMESEHDRVDGDLARMGVMAGEAPVTPANDRAWADCRAALDRFAGELTAHAHFENGWLFPRALDLEQSLV
jgi:regulator of cell morphogenesis and NO signaling